MGRPRPALEVLVMLRKVLPMVLVSVAMSVAMALLVATLRTQAVRPDLGRFFRRAGDDAGEPVDITVPGSEA
jgi:hypothetical protein